MCKKDVLKDLEHDLGPMHEEIRQLDQVDDADQASTMQKVTHLQHKVELALQDRLATHQLLQKRLHLVETRMIGWEKLKDILTTMQENLSSVQDVQRQILAMVIEMGENLDALVNTEQLASSPVVDDRVSNSVSSRTGARGYHLCWRRMRSRMIPGIPDLGPKDDFSEGFSFRDIWWFYGQQRAS